ncbi:MAG: PAS domain S-box protein [Candidatus Bathyarchaeia archaeon]
MAKSSVEASAKIVMDLEEKECIRVLHVDDENGFLKVAKQCLELDGSLEVDTACSVEDALEKMRKKKFDAVVSDYQMPEKDGLEFLRQLREGGNNIPFIIFTGKGREEVAVQALNLGADRYLNKAGDPEAVYGELAYAISNAVEKRRAERRLKESEARYRHLCENTKALILAVDLKGKITFVNEVVKDYGFQKAEIIGKNMLNFVPKKYWPKLLKELAQTARGKPTEGEVEINTPKGRIMVEYRSTPIMLDGRVVGDQSVLTDITERKRMELELEKSRERYRRQFEEAIDAIFLADADTGRLVDCNRAAEQLVGRAKSELIGRHQRILHPPEEVEGRFSETFKQHLKEKRGQTLETQVVTKDGEVRDVAIKANVFELEGKRLMQGIFRDVTERKRYEQRLSALNVYSQKLNTAESVKAIYGLTLEAMEKMLGFDIAFFMVVDGDMLRLVHHHGYPEQFSIELPLNGTKRGVSVRVANTGRSINVPDAEKEEAWIEFMPGIRSGLVVPVKIGRKVLGVIGVDSRELNAFNEKDQELLEILGSHAATAMSNVEYAENLETQTRKIGESRQKFEALFVGNPEAAVYVGLDFRIVDVNPCFCRLFGYSAEEVKGEKLNDVVVPENLMKEAERLDRDAEKGYAHHETVRKRSDGSLVPVIISAAPIVLEGKLLGYVGMYKDITELKKAYQLSEEARRHFQTLFDLMADPVAIIGERGKILEVTQRVEEITGFKKEELVEKNFLRTEIATAKTKAVMMKNLAKRMIGINVAPYEVELLAKDGRKVPVEVNAAKIDYKGRPADLVVFRDVSERKKLEEKLRVVGGLTRHDVRNKLSAVVGNVYLLKQRLARDAEALEKLDDLEAAVRNVEVIFDFAAAYERLGVEQLTEIDVGEAFDEAASLFSDLNVEVVNICGGLTVMADSLLRQLFYNLIDNSLKYGGKTRQIKLYCEEKSDKLKLIYEDDGVGVPNNMRKNLFKEGCGKGTGYGLFMIKRICEVYGWIIQETGKQGKGAQFTITIPKKAKNEEKFRHSHK